MLKTLLCTLQLYTYYIHFWNINVFKSFLNIIILGSSLILEGNEFHMCGVYAMNEDAPLDDFTL